MPSQSRLKRFFTLIQCTVKVFTSSSWHTNQPNKSGKIPKNHFKPPKTQAYKKLKASVNWNELKITSKLIFEENFSNLPKLKRRLLCSKLIFFLRWLFLNFWILFAGVSVFFAHEWIFFGGPNSKNNYSSSFFFHRCKSFIIDTKS